MIPVMVMAYLFNLLLWIIVFVSWVVIVITGKQPTGLFDMLKMSLTYVARAGVYYGLMTEQFPPVSPDDGALPATGGVTSTI